MLLPENYNVIRKDVKHARLKVAEDGSVRVIIPRTFTQEEVEAMLSKKMNWIEQQRMFFKGMAKISLQRNQILLYGNRYCYFYDSTYEHKIIVDHEYKTIRAKRNLLDESIQHKWYVGLGKKYLINRTKDIAEQLGFRYNKVYIRNQRTKWGNCSGTKNISLNWRLMKAPVFVSDYIIVHELLHTVVMNHTHKFWTMLKSYYPDYKEAIKWLDTYGNSL